MRSYIKALIFDLDGTLADTIPSICEAINMTMEKLELPTHTENDIRNAIGHGPRHLITELIPREIREENPDIVDKALSVYDQMYSKTYMHVDRLYDGLEGAILELSKYYKIAVLSNKQDEYVKALVKQLLPAGICEIARGSIDGVPAKPDPSVARMIAHELGADTHECMIIGDSDIDIQTAEYAECDILSVSWGYVSKTKLVLHGAQEIINSPYELVEYFK